MFHQFFQFSIDLIFTTLGTRAESYTFIIIKITFVKHTRKTSLFLLFFSNTQIHYLFYYNKMNKSSLTNQNEALCYAWRDLAFNRIRIQNISFKENTTRLMNGVFLYFLRFLLLSLHLYKHQLFYVFLFFFFQLLFCYLIIIVFDFYDNNNNKL